MINGFSQTVFEDEYMVEKAITIVQALLSLIEWKIPTI
jgi:hypothetical protein